MKIPAVYIGCAGWSIPRDAADRFPRAGSHLERYARVLPAVEINSSFYRDHQRSTYERWAASVPAGFRFAIKLHRAITHRARLRGARRSLERFLDGVRGLGRKLGPILVQLPPSLRFDGRRVRPFFAILRDLHDGPVVCEPRHASWFADGPERLLEEYRIARVAADPPPVPGADEPGGWPRLIYYRLHGRPRRYYSAYDEATLAGLTASLTRYPRKTTVWCIFDNTAAGAATGNALWVWERLSKPPSR